MSHAVKSVTQIAPVSNSNYHARWDERSNSLNNYPKVVASPGRSRDIIYAGRFRDTTGPGFLPNDSHNYSMSPAARHATQDGSLEPVLKPTFSLTSNRKLKMRDTFSKILPTYTHGEPTAYTGENKSLQHARFVYPKRNDDGRITYNINREYTHKIDQMKSYKEQMYRMNDMVSCFKHAGRGAAPTGGK